MPRQGTVMPSMNSGVFGDVEEGFLMRRPVAPIRTTMDLNRREESVEERRFSAASRRLHG